MKHFIFVLFLILCLASPQANAAYEGVYQIDPVAYANGLKADQLRRWFTFEQRRILIGQEHVNGAGNVKLPAGTEIRLWLKGGETVRLIRQGESGSFPKVAYSKGEGVFLERFASHNDQNLPVNLLKAPWSGPSVLRLVNQTDKEQRFKLHHENFADAANLWPHRDWVSLNGLSSHRLINDSNREKRVYKFPAFKRQVLSIEGSGSDLRLDLSLLFKGHEQSLRKNVSLRFYLDGKLWKETVVSQRLDETGPRIDGRQIALGRETALFIRTPKSSKQLSFESSHDLFVRMLSGKRSPVLFTELNGAISKAPLLPDGFVEASQTLSKLNAQGNMKAARYFASLENLRPHDQTLINMVRRFEGQLTFFQRRIPKAPAQKDIFVPNLRILKTPGREDHHHFRPKNAEADDIQGFDKGKDLAYDLSDAQGTANEVQIDVAVDGHVDFEILDQSSNKIARIFKLESALGQSHYKQNTVGTRTIARIALDVPSGVKTLHLQGKALPAIRFAVREGADPSLLPLVWAAKGQGFDYLAALLGKTNACKAKQSFEGCLARDAEISFSLRESLYFLAIQKEIYLNGISYWEAAEGPASRDEALLAERRNQPIKALKLWRGLQNAVGLESYQKQADLLLQAKEYSRVKRLWRSLSAFHQDEKIRDFAFNAYLELIEPEDQIPVLASWLMENPQPDLLGRLVKNLINARSYTHAQVLGAFIAPEKRDETLNALLLKSDFPSRDAYANPVIWQNADHLVLAHGGEAIARSDLNDEDIRFYRVTKNAPLVLKTSQKETLRLFARPLHHALARQDVVLTFKTEKQAHTRVFVDNQPSQTLKGREGTTPGNSEKVDFTLNGVISIVPEQGEIWVSLAMKQPVFKLPPRLEEYPNQTTAQYEETTQRQDTSLRFERESFLDDVWVKLEKANQNQAERLFLQTAIKVEQSDKLDDREKAIWQLLERRYARWKAISDVIVSAGVRREEIEGYAPSSQTSYLLEALLPQMDSSEMLMQGGSNLVYDLNLSHGGALVLKARRLKMPGESFSPVSLVVDGSSGKKTGLSFSGSENVKTIRLPLKRGENHIELQTQPVQTGDYFAVSLHLNGVALTNKRSRFYHVALPGEPVVIDAQGPGMVEVMKQSVKGQTSFERIILQENTSKRLVFSSKSSAGTFYRLSMLTYDPLKEKATIALSQSLDIAEIERTIPQLPLLEPDTYENLLEEGFDGSTWSFSSSIMREEARDSESAGGNTASDFDWMPEISIGLHKYQPFEQRYLSGDLSVRDPFGTERTTQLSGRFDQPIEASPYRIKGEVQLAHQAPDKASSATKVQMNVGARRVYEFSPKINQVFELEGFARYLSKDDSVSSGGVYDSTVWSSYKSDHLHGVNFKYRLNYSPFMDSRLRAEMGSYSNEDLNLFAPDKLQTTLGWQQLWGPVSSDVFWRGRNFRGDDDRRSSSFDHKIGLSIDWMLPDNISENLFAKFDAKRDLSNQSWTGLISFEYLLNNGRGNRNLRPEYRRFISLRDRHLLEGRQP